jgi:hypothetical protein
MQLSQVFLDPTKMRTWLKYGGILHHLFVACVSVYGLSILAGFLLWRQPQPPSFITATIMVVFGFAIIFLAGVLRLVYRIYPEAEADRNDQFGLSFDHSMLLLTGVFMILIGALLIPVNLGLLPFSGSAQLGLLMIIFAIQMLASGNTPIGPFPHRSCFMVVSGIVFAALGIVSCVVPGVLVAPLTYLVGVLNILGGLIPLGKRLLLSVKSANENVAHPLLLNLSRTQLALNLLSIMFGSSMLVPGIIPGLVIGVILAANGAVLLYLLHLLVLIDALGNQAKNTP